MLRKLRMDEARGLGHVDIFREPSMEEGILNINLTDEPSGGDGKGENQANGGRLDHWTVGLAKSMPGC
jgi:hypothetical protein